MKKTILKISTFILMVMCLFISNVKAITVSQLKIDEGKNVEDNVKVECTDDDNNNCTLTLIGEAKQDIQIQGDETITLKLNNNILKGYTAGAAVIEILGNGKLTIEGNGTIKAADEATAVPMIVVKSGATLIVEGGTIEVPAVNKMIGISNEGNLMVNNITITTATIETSIGNEGAWGIVNYNEATIKGGTFTQGNAYSIVSNNKTMTISGGTFNTSGNGIHNGLLTNAGSAEAKLTITDGDFTSYTGQKVISNTGGTTKIEGGVFTEDENVDSEVAAYKYMENAVRYDDKVYAGTSIDEVTESAKSGDTIEVLKGDYTATDLPTGVTVENKSGGIVTVNGHDVTEEGSYTVPSTSSSSSSSSSDSNNTKDYNVTDNVTYISNGEDIDIKGKVITEANDTYAKMVKLAQDRGYAKLFNMYDIYEVNNKSLTKSLTLTFNLGEENNGKYAYILHLKHDNTYEKWEQEVVDGKVSISVSELSPFIVALKDKEENKEENKGEVSNPQTSSINVIALGLISTTSLIGLITLVKKNRKNI